MIIADATSDDGSPADAAPLFFSEYAEGSSNNKYLEIFNPTSEVVDLSNYAYPSVSNAPTTPGVHEYWNTFDSAATIAPGGVYVIAHPSSDSTILEQADETHAYLSNGDDGYALAFGSETSHVILDMVGDFNGDPGSGWEVAGVSNATKDHTLIRKMSVTSGNTDWALSAGTNADDSEWVVLDQDTWDYLGSHEELQIVILGCTDPEAFNYNNQATEDDGSCIATVLGCTWESADNYNPDANTNDGSCFTTTLGCTDSLALNYDSLANTENNSCIYSYDELTNALSLQGVLDLSLSGSDGKALHLVALSDVADLSSFGIGVANNGGGSDGQDYSLSQASLSAGDQILLASSPDAISAYFADCAANFDTIMFATLYINGDDAIELYEQGVVIETFGDVNVDGTGEAWEYTDSWAYKVDGEWTYGGVNCTDGSSVFSESACPYPICDGVAISGCMDNGLELNGVGELADYDGDGMPAFNYNPNATEENGTCITVTYGCTNQLADNYDSSANTNDGSCTFEAPNPLFFSEYAEGSSNNKYLEIYNSGSDTVDLADYAYPSVSNAPSTVGEYEYWNTFDEGATIAPGDVYVIAHPSSDSTILAQADETHSYLSNGDDGYALAMGTEDNHVYIDWVGDFNGDPGSSWSVCTDGDTQDNTLVRNCDVMMGSEWSVSSSEESCQWTVLPNNTWDDLGVHCTQPEPVGCDAPADWNVIVTGSNHTIVIPSSTIVTLADGNELDHANVGVFYTNSDGNLACAGSAEITPGETVQIAAMGDDTTTPEVDGLVSGSDLVWMIADCYGNVFAANATYTGGPEIFTINGITNVSTITEAPAGPSEQELSFPTGWSMFSTYMIPADLNLANLLSPIVDQVIIAKDYLGAAYLPEWNFNGIGDLTLGQGYQIKTTESTGVTVTGDYAMPQDNPINLTVGWNMVAYLRLEPAAADAAFADINATGNLIIAKDYLGAAYLPEWNFNGIGDLNPGQAYQLKVNNADVLQYLSNDDSYRMSAMEVTENNVSHYAKLAPTDNNMTVVIEDAAWDVLPTEGSEIAAFDKDGNMVGSAIYSSPVTVVTVWGDDATTTSKDGMLVSESVSFKVWNTNEVLDFTVAKWIEGSSSYQVDGISVASTIETNNVMTELNASERVLVKVINVLGQEVNLDDQPFKGTVLFNVYDDGSVERFVE